MEYKGELYAKIADKYIEISHTDEFEKLKKEIFDLKDKLNISEIHHGYRLRTNNEMYEKIDKLLDFISETKIAYDWWINERKQGLGVKIDSGDMEHYEKMKQILADYER